MMIWFRIGIGHVLSWILVTGVVGVGGGGVFHEEEIAL
jgi:hypothetical protein